MPCDHTIGQKIFGTQLITVSDALHYAKERQIVVYRLTGEQVCLSEFTKSMYRFEYCPHCGIKIDWAEIRRIFKEEQEA